MAASTSPYLLAKTDQNFSLVYCNDAFTHLLHKSLNKCLGTDLNRFWKESLPLTVQNYIQTLFETNGFYNCFVPLLIDGSERWYFIDFGKRHSASGAVLGFEYIAYPPAKDGVSFFKRLYHELAQLESSNSYTAELAMERFLQAISTKGYSYEELVCIFQSV